MLVMVRVGEKEDRKRKYAEHIEGYGTGGRKKIERE